MDYLEFREEFLETIKADAAVTGEGTCASFVSEMANYLIESEVLMDFTPAYRSGTGKSNKKYRIDGYAFDEIDNTFNLVIAVFDGIETNIFAKTEMKSAVSKVTYFVDLAINSTLYREVEISTPCADLIDLLRINRVRTHKYRILIFTDSEMSTTLKTIDEFEIDGKPAECQIWDIERLFRVCCSDTGRQTIEIDFRKYVSQGIPCLETTELESLLYKSYLCIIPGKVLADIYDKYGSALLEGNVRSFLSTKVAVNKKIRETILKSPTMFFAFNNGISATALDVTIEDTAQGKVITSAKDFQIINGGQTTASLSNTRYKDKSTLDGILVQMKLTQIGEMDETEASDLIRNISRSSNSQNKVSDADFFATHPFHIRIEQFSRRVFAPAVFGAQYESKWFYERARGQYLQAQMRMTTAKKKQFQLQNPKSNVISKTDLAKYRNTWSGLPHIVSKGAQTNFMKFAELIDEKWQENDLRFNEKYYTDSVSLAILFKHLEQLIPKQSWYEQGYRANIVTYTIALLHKCILDQFPGHDLDLQLIWNKQAVPEILNKPLCELAKLVYDKITADDRLTVNVTQWCKREECWKRVKAIEYKLPDSLNVLLIDKKSARKEEQQATADQKIASGVEAQAKVLKYSADQWKEITKVAREKGFVGPIEEDALATACKIPVRIPNSFQAAKLLDLLAKLESEGLLFIGNQNE
ncbi:AIPR protein [Ruminococcaceae bacterium KH2T8]|nr:AIPR protein [Ruminococcaceae bacterium KH2T8]